MTRERGWRCDAERTCFCALYDFGALKAVTWFYPWLNRSTVYSRAQKEGLQKRLRWSSSDVVRLTRMTELGKTVEEIAAALGRTPEAVHFHKLRLRIGVGVPQGFETIAVAARRAGFTAATLLHILQARGVKLHKTFSYRKRSYAHRHVDVFDVDTAVAAYTKEEVFLPGTLSRGMTEPVMRIMLAELGCKPPSRGCWRIAGETLDAATKLFRESETITAAASRHGVWANSISKWATLLGVKRIGSRPCWIRKEDADRVVAAMRANRVEQIARMRRRASVVTDQHVAAQTHNVEAAE